MTTTVAAVLSVVAVDLQEDSSFSSGLWSFGEMLGYVNYAEVDFLRRTGILMVDVTMSANPTAGLLFQKPANCMDVERISFDGKKLYRVTAWDLARENRNWRNANPRYPKYFHEDTSVLNSFETDNLPTNTSGTFRIFADYLPTPHTSTSENLTVPDAWIQYLEWEILSLALSRDGDGQDLARAKYSHERYLFGVGLATRLIRGDIDQPVQ